MNENTLKEVQAKFVEFQNSIAEQYGVILQPGMNLVPVQKQEEAKSPEVTEEKVAE